MIEDFAHLHAHTEFSVLDGLGSLTRQMTIAKSRGFRSLAMTDHGTLAGAIGFTIEAQRQGIKPLLGLEGYYEVDGQIGHITLLADGNRGFSNLVKLNNIAHRSDFRQPAFNTDQLIKHADGLLCLTGCPASPLQSMTMGDALSLGARLKGAFGKRLFAEVMFVSDFDTWTRPLALADRLGINPVVTNDVHFGLNEDAVVHPILTNMKGGFEYNSQELWLKNSSEIHDRALRLGVPDRLVTKGLQVAAFISNKLGVVELAKVPSLPHVDNPKEIITKKIAAALKDGGYTKAYKERATYELKVINEMGYLSYFVILLDIIDAAEKLDVKVGPGRGSGAGSLVLYLLGVTDIDPIKYGLSFERFLNPERRGMPDVDIDFDSEGRDKILGYAAEKYGGVPIATYAKYTHKVLTHDLSRQMRVDKDLDNEAADGGENSRQFKKICSTVDNFKLAYDAIRNQVRHKGKHAGGVIITDVEVPVERLADKTLAAAWSEGARNELSYAGIVKFDLLGISVLSALRRLEAKIGKVPPEPTAGHEVFQLFRKGDLDGIFQFSGSPGIRDVTVKLRPDSFEELVAINALYRPGALDAGSVDMFPEWKKVPRKVPAYIEPILRETYGAVVYQEQVMAIFQATVGGTYGQADLARRLIVKSKPDDPTWVKKFDKLREDFVAGAMEHKLTEEQALDLWHELATHARYSFNKSHSVAYSMIAWQTAWWKFYYPSHFFAAMMNVDPKDSQKMVMAAAQHGIEIVPPDINQSSNEWEADDEKIYMPLSSVKFMGSNGVDEILARRAELPGAKFSSLDEFMKVVAKRKVTARAREGLFNLGAFSKIAKFDDEEWAKLGIKRDFNPKVTRYEAEVNFLGFVIPTKKLLSTFEKYAAKGLTCGIIDKIKKKKSAYGPYSVYYLTPSGVFWSREADLSVGDVVVAQVSSKNGKGTKIEILRSVK